MTPLKMDPVHRKIMKTRDAFVDEDKFDQGYASVAAVKRIKFPWNVCQKRDSTFLMKISIMKRTLACLMD